MSLEMGRKVFIPFTISETDLLAGTSQETVSPVKGFVEKIITVVQKAVTTGGTITCSVGTTAVDGLSVTIADAAAKGTVQSDTPTQNHASRAVAEDGRIQVIPDAAFDTAGAVSGWVVVNSGH